MNDNISGFGSIVVYTNEQFRGKDVKVTNTRNRNEFHANVVGRRVDGEVVYSAVFPRLETGKYTVFIHRNGPDLYATVDVWQDNIAEVDWGHEKP